MCALLVVCVFTIGARNGGHCWRKVCAHLVFFPGKIRFWYKKMAAWNCIQAATEYISGAPLADDPILDTHWHDCQFPLPQPQRPPGYARHRSAGSPHQRRLRHRPGKSCRDPIPLQKKWPIFLKVWLYRANEKMKGSWGFALFLILSSTSTHAYLNHLQICEPVFPATQASLLDDVSAEPMGAIALTALDEVEATVLHLGSMVDHCWPPKITGGWWTDGQSLRVLKFDLYIRLVGWTVGLFLLFLFLCDSSPSPPGVEKCLASKYKRRHSSPSAATRVPAEKFSSSKATLEAQMNWWLVVEIHTLTGPIGDFWPSHCRWGFCHQYGYGQSRSGVVTRKGKGYSWSTNTKNGSKTGLLNSWLSSLGVQKQVLLEALEHLDATSLLAYSFQTPAQA